MFSKIGLVAGSGNLPKNIIDYCNYNNIEIYVVLLKDFTKDKKYYNCRNFIKTGIGRVGKILNYFKKNKVSNIVFAGGIKRPSLSGIFVDFKGFLLLKKIIKNRKLGDNNISEIIIEFLKNENINVVKIDDILEDCKLKEGSNTSMKINKEYQEDIKIGVDLLNMISPFDVGQSVVVQQKNIIGIEGIEGTAGLIRRCGDMKYKKGRKPILVKMKKIGQTDKIDLPSIGVNTIKQLSDYGFAGIVLDYKNCIVIDKEKVLALAKKKKVFIYGIE